MIAKNSLFLIFILTKSVCCIYDYSASQNQRLTNNEFRPHQNVIVHGAYSQVKTHKPLEQHFGRSDSNTHLDYSNLPLVTAETSHTAFVNSETRRQSREQEFDDQNDVFEASTKCPPRKTGQYPYSLDCRQYLNCWKGRGYIENCAPGTLFNPETHQCDFPSKVKCNGVHNKGSAKQQPAQANNDNFEVFKDIVGHYNQPENRYTAASVLHQQGNELDHTEPKVKCNKTDLTPHPFECDKFLVCVGGKIQIMGCPPGTKFNPLRQICDFPQHVNCVRGTNENLSTTDSNGIPNTQNSNERRNSTYNRFNQSHSHHNHNHSSHKNQQTHQNMKQQQNRYTAAPDRNKELVHTEPTVQCDINQSGLIAHPYDCDKYLNCANGVTFIMTCGPGTQYNPLMQICDWPQNVNCVRQPYANIRTTTEAEGEFDNYNYGEQYIEPRVDVEPTTRRTYDGSHRTGKHFDYNNYNNRNTQSTPSTQYYYSTTERYLETSLQEPLSRHLTTPINTANVKPKADEENRPVYNHQYYNQNTNYVTSTPDSTNISSLPISEAMKFLLRPYFRDNAQEMPSLHLNLTTTQRTTTNSNRNFITQNSSERKNSTYNSFNRSHSHHSQNHSHSDNQPPYQHISQQHQNQHRDSPQQETIYQNNYPHHQSNNNNQQILINQNLNRQPSGGRLISSSEHQQRIDQPQISTASRSNWELVTPVPAPSPTGTKVVFYNRDGDFDTRDCYNKFDCGDQICIPLEKTCDGKFDCGNRLDEANCDHIGYQVRLSNENDHKHEGRVEVKVYDKWGYICDDKFGMRDADVLCKELGFSLGASEIRLNSYYGANVNMTEGNRTIFIMDELDCLGNETSLKECVFNGWGIHDCNKEEIVGVVCKIPVMTCPSDYWLCDTSQECIPTGFLCDNVPDCTDHSDENISHCNAPLEFRLVDGKSNNEGRVEVKYRGIWGTICDDDFANKEAAVICRSLGFTGPSVIVKNTFRQGTGQIWLDQVSCNGNESNIDKCIHWHWGEHNCGHSEDVGVRCSNDTSENVPTNRSHAKGRSYIGESENYFMEKSSRILPDECGAIKVAEPVPSDVEFKVIRGTQTYRGQHPWQAAIRAKKQGKSAHWCGAVLISRFHLLTAAHCLIGYPKGAYLVRLGDFNTETVEDSEREAFIENIYIHEDFRKGQHMNNDIAVVLLKNPVRFSDHIQPICLPSKDTIYETNKNCTISGWGSIQSGSSTTSLDLRAGHVPILSQGTCKQPQIYGDVITEGMFCAGSLDESVDACDGDSGGPLVCSNNGAHTLFGIISWGQHCGFANKPGVYVKVIHYLDWIEEKLNHSMQHYGV